ncbi:MAG: hypothetical protein IJ344_03790, partial [Clostridia bacterium]|nr:hypothetical protein [Clostridia bacterium]
MEHSFFSLIYKTKERKDLLSFHALGEVIKQLDAQWLLHAPKTDWLAYITDDLDTIRYREEAFADIARHPALADLCAQCAEKLDAIDALRRIKEGQQTNETMLYSIKEVELYLDLTALLKDALDPLAKDLCSDSFKGLYTLVK